MNKVTFAGYVKEYRGMVRSAILKLIPSLNYNFLDDVEQEVWLKAWESREQFDPEKSQIQTWLYNVATTVGIDHIRSENAEKRPELLYLDHVLPQGGTSEDEEIPYYEDSPNPAAFGSDSMPGHSPSAEDEALAMQRSSLMRKRVDMLAQRERDILSLAYDQDYSAREIADELGLEYDNVRQIMARSRKFVTRG